MHTIDEEPRDAPVVLMLHGEPSWCFLYREVVRVVLDAGLGGGARRGGRGVHQGLMKG